MVISRLAPTPNGFLHLGNLYNFAFTWNEVRRAGGKLWLRLDDADIGRVRPEYVDDVLENLRWFGMDVDEGPVRQSQRTGLYRSWLGRFPGYACRCTRKEIMQRTGGSVEYDGHCRGLGLQFKAGENQWRFRASNPADDQVLWRREDLPGYHLASLVDDLTLGINLVVRGEDLRDSTRMQLLLAESLGELGRPFREARFEFHRLVEGPNGEKLSKSLGATSLRSLRGSGRTREEIFRMLGRGSLTEF